MPETSQVHCPTCNAALPTSSDRNYTCGFCLTPFSLVEARREEERLSDEIKAWLQQKIGAVSPTAGAVDASSRNFIFRQKLLPELQRDADRALEAFGAYGQVPLIAPPVACPQPGQRGGNPLVLRRGDILGLRSLRARFTDDQVATFAVADSDRQAIQDMDRRLSDLLFLSNVADAAARKDRRGYESAGRNLRELLAEIDQSLSSRGVGREALLDFLGCVQERYRCLLEFAAGCAEVTSENAISGGVVADRLRELSGRLRAVARRFEACPHSPAETMPMVVGANIEASNCDSLARWLIAYDAIAWRSGIDFRSFAAEIEARLGESDPVRLIDLIEQCSEVVRAVRREIAVPAVAEFGWVRARVEQGRAKKTFGLFGTEESVALSDEFLMPVWLADVSFSAGAGSVFRQGAEASCIAVVDACGPDARRVQFFDALQGSPLAQLEYPDVLPTVEVAMPRSTPGQAQTAFDAAVRGRAGMMNARARIRGLAYLPAVAVTYQARGATREAVSCLGGRIPVDASARVGRQSARELLQLFG